MSMTIPATGTGTTARYGTVLTPAQLAPGWFPSPRGRLTEYLAARLRAAPRTLHGWPDPADDVLSGEDGALALYCLYELHYRGFADVDDGWEWEPSLLALRAGLERRFLAEVRAVTGEPRAGSTIQADDIPDVLTAVVAAGDGPSVSDHLDRRATLADFREFAIHRSIYQLKEADPHTFAIPRLVGRAKAAMVEIQADEYGAGIERDMHQTLFGLTMTTLGLDPSYGAYLDLVPGVTLATVNLPSFLGLHRRWRGALVGHLACFEMTSVEPMARAAGALRRLGIGPAGRHFYEVHVVADAHHETVAARDLAGGLVRDTPALAADVVFGAQAAMAVEERWARSVVPAWITGRSSLRPGLPVPAA
ncbi:MAG: iron-containing redox enzyme family protein [Frankia sp.]